MRASWPWLAAAALACGCANDWRTDMWDQPTSRASATPRLEPVGSIPLGATPRVAGREAAAALVNPVARTNESLARGRATFLVRCAPCHGEDGRGRGPVSRLFPQPADLMSRTVRARADGYLWGQITFGGDAMPPMAEGLTETSRWDVVNAVRALQGAPGGGP